MRRHSAGATNGASFIASPHQVIDASCHQIHRGIIAIANLEYRDVSLSPDHMFRLNKKLGLNSTKRPCKSREPSVHTFE